MNIKRMICICAGVGLMTAPLVSESHRNARPRTGSTREIPKFEVDPSWPKIPNGWTLGQVSSAASDEQDNIWILHRPRTVKPGVKTGPTVMEFDQAGNYIQGWADRVRAMIGLKRSTVYS